MGKIPPSGVRSTVRERRRSRAPLPRETLLNLSKKCLYLFTGLTKGKKALEKGNFKIGPGEGSIWEGRAAVFCASWWSLPGCEDGSPRVSRSAPSGPQRLALATSQLPVSPVALSQLFIIAGNRGTSSGSSSSNATHGHWPLSGGVANPAAAREAARPPPCAPPAHQTLPEATERRRAA